MKEERAVFARHARQTFVFFLIYVPFNCIIQSILK